MTKVFIDGSAGTTGLRIYERLEKRKDIELLKLSEEKRKDKNARKEALNSADIAFLCLPDDAARESVSLCENESTVIIDTSTAHRTAENFAYGFPELSAGYKAKISVSKRIAVPGCHASGFISLIYPLTENGIIEKSALLSCFSVTGYSGGGKKMIAEYEGENRDILLSSPRQYGIGQMHKHLPEMVAVTGLENKPVFSPVVADFYSGMVVTVPLVNRLLNIKDGEKICEMLKEFYKDKPLIKVHSYNEMTPDGFVASNTLSGKDNLEIFVYGHSEQTIIISRFDNLGKGSSGAAVQCMNIMLGTNETKGLVY